MPVSHPIAEPDVIAIQPEPVMTRVVHFRILGRTVTAIMRLWKPGDSGPGGRCKLCHRCGAYDDGCLMQFNRFVAREEAPLFAPDSIPGMTWQNNRTTRCVAPTGEPAESRAEPEPTAETWRDRTPLF
jgi:hypothetical protein